jgi:ribokinase
MVLFIFQLVPIQTVEPPMSSSPCKRCQTAPVDRGVTVLGSANVDIFLRVRTLPAAGETVLANGRQEHPGGKGLNQAVAAVRAGAVTSFVGSLGQDASGDLLLASLQEASIDTSAVTRVETPSGSAVIVVQDSGENTIVVDAGANGVLVALSAPARAAVQRCGVLLCQLEVPVVVVAEATTLARQAGITVVLNASPVAPLDDSVLFSVDVLVVNEHEARALAGYGGSDAVAAAVTLAAAVRDTTGAGDTFAGVFAASVAAGETVGAAVRRAVVAGALAVERDGAGPSIPTRAAVDARLAEVRDRNND